MKLEPMSIKKVTAQQCSTNEIVELEVVGIPNERAAYTRIGIAFWHPQWGGYGAHAVMVPSNCPSGPNDAAMAEECPPEEMCFDVYVWHNGEFPYDGDKPPREYHYCQSAQVARMAKLAEMANTVAGFTNLCPGDTIWGTESDMLRGRRSDGK